MLIDATHPEETRVVVLRGNRVEEFDFESAHRKQLRGNIYLAKVTRVEPSLQAAFVDYGGNRHGFLAFSEIHPDYYQIPVADRQLLIDEDERAQRAADDEVDRRSRRHRHRGRPAAARRDDEVRQSEPTEAAPDDSMAAEPMAETPNEDDESAFEPIDSTAAEPISETMAAHGDAESEAPAEPPQPMSADSDHGEADEPPADITEIAAVEMSEPTGTEAEAGIDEVIAMAGEASQQETAASDGADEENGDDEAAEEIVESVGGADALEEVPDRAPRYRRQYKIQEVIKRRQVMLVQVVKEERGTKGAALTTYLSLAGRYSVLMPNTARGGGISRKITSSEDRARLKEVAQELEVPEGMGVILRTAGASRTKTEVKRDFEYLLRLWETVRDLTLKSTAPKLVYEEGSLVKRSIRDLYSKDIDEVTVAGSEAYREAKDFMRMLMPTHAKNVKLYSDTQPLLSRYGVENQLDAMFSPVVQLRSGGYIVLNQAEALVAIDVNSGRATREHHIEDTALKTNMEAAEEVSRQLRLRDLAGLIVIDFIDMDEKRNNRSVERRLKECLKHDRARIQVGRISHFGLLEMSRQRIRTSVLESSTEKCPYCGGSGHVRSVSSLALQVLRALEEQLMKGATHNLTARTRPDVALYVLNQKRAHLRGLEERFAITITVVADETVAAPQAFVIDRGEQVHTIEAARALAEQSQAVAVAAAPLEEEDNLELEHEDVETDDEDAEAEIEATAPNTVPEHDEPGEHGDGRPRRRRRRRGRNGRDNGDQPRHEHIPIHDDAAETADPASADDDGVEDQHGEPVAAEGTERGERAEPQRDGRRRRRGRRGGRRNRHERNGDAVQNDRGDYDRDAAPPQHSFAPEEDLATPPAAEPEPGEAVADFDAAPPAAPPAVPTAMSPPELAEPEPPRRRSTVRERAPIAGSGDTAHPAQPEPAPAAEPAPQPAVSEPGESENADRPRRTGWWSRRLAGD
jgi:ribonuclease E